MKLLEGFRTMGNDTVLKFVIGFIISTTLISTCATVHLVGPRENETGRFLYPDAATGKMTQCKFCRPEALSDSTYVQEQHHSCLSHYIDSNVTDYYKDILTDYERNKSKFAFCWTGETPACPQTLPKLPGWNWQDHEGNECRNIPVYENCTFHSGDVHYNFYCTENLTLSPPPLSPKDIPHCPKLPKKIGYTWNCSHGYNHTQRVPALTSCHPQSTSIVEGQGLNGILCQMNGSWSDDPESLFLVPGTKPEDTNLPWILGGSIGAVVIVLLILAAIYCIRRKLKKQRSSLSSYLPQVIELTTIPNTGNVSPDSGRGTTRDSNDGSCGTNSSISQSPEGSQNSVSQGSTQQPGEGSSKSQGSTQQPGEGTYVSQGSTQRPGEGSYVSQGSTQRPGEGSYVSQGSTQRPGEGEGADSPLLISENERSNGPECNGSGNQGDDLNPQRKAVEHDDKESNTTTNYTPEGSKSLPEKAPKVRNNPAPHRVVADSNVVKVRVFHKDIQNASQYIPPYQENAYIVPKGYTFYVSVKWPKNMICKHFNIQRKDNEKHRGRPLLPGMDGIYVFENARSDDEGDYIWTIHLDNQTIQGIVSVFISKAGEENTERQAPLGQERSLSIQGAAAAAAAEQVPVSDVADGSLPTHRSSLFTLGPSLTLGSLGSSHLTHSSGPEYVAPLPQSEEGNQEHGTLTGCGTLDPKTFDEDETSPKTPAPVVLGDEDRPAVIGRSSNSGSQGCVQSQGAHSMEECKMKIDAMPTYIKQMLGHYGDPSDKVDLHRTSFGLGEHYGMTPAHLKAIWWHRRGFVGNGPTQFVLEHLGKIKGLYMIDIVKFFLKVSRKDILTYISEVHSNCSSCRQLLKDTDRR